MTEMFVSRAMTNDDQEPLDFDSFDLRLAASENSHRPQRPPKGDTAIVIDNGSWQCRYGYANADSPSCMLAFPLALLTPAHSL